ncbi:MAG: hypothetical protein NZM12_04075, partial [Steroidobacteraceae bacterium]|nr:hypothetical protein [Steroidobacteraceae bacterium]
EVIPLLWLPLSVLLLWLVPRWLEDWRARRAATLLPLGWFVLVLVFFSLSSGKRGVYILPALPALAIAAAPHLPALYSRRSVQRLSLCLAGALAAGFVVALAAVLAGVERIERLLSQANVAFALLAALAASLAGAWVVAWRWRPILAWPAVLAVLAVFFGFGIAPAMNPERSGSRFMAAVQRMVGPEEQLGLVAYKEQFLLHLRRPSVNFGHRRWREGPQEPFDAAAWLAAAPNRVLLVPNEYLRPCFAGPGVRLAAAGEASREHWWLVRGQPAAACVAAGNPARAISYW